MNILDVVDQDSLYDSNDIQKAHSKPSATDHVIDKIRLEFGKNSIVRAGQLKKKNR